MTDQPISKGAKTRERVLESAARLFQRQGYGATSINQIIAESGQPKGSLYFHFPGGKQEIAAASVVRSSQNIATLIDEVFAHAASPEEAATIICMAFSNQLKSSDYREGCSISPLAISAGKEASSLRKVCATAYDEWLLAIEAGLRRYCVADQLCTSLASLVLSSVEGAILLSQARHNTQALDMLPSSLAPLFQDKCMNQTI